MRWVGRIPESVQQPCPLDIEVVVGVPADPPTDCSGGASAQNMNACGTTLFDDTGTQRPGVDPPEDPTVTTVPNGRTSQHDRIGTDVG